MKTKPRPRKKPIRRIQKVCPRCNENKPLSAYYATKQTYCIDCMKAISRERYHNSLRVNITTRIHARLSATLPPGTPLAPLYEGVLPYSFDDLVFHLRTRVPENFTWQDLFNGKLQIDHCRPIASFRYTGTDDPNFKRCWSLGNITVTPTEHNLRKGSRWANGVMCRRKK